MFQTPVFLIFTDNSNELVFDSFTTSTVPTLQIFFSLLQYLKFRKKLSPTLNGNRKSKFGNFHVLKNNLFTRLYKYKAT